MSNDLKRGDKIPGSLLFRDFCAHCQQPMRVGRSFLFLDPEETISRANYCNECDGPPPPAHTGLVARQRHGCAKTDT